ncbi:MAG: hypothetical protein ACR2OV_00060 [Hyphomicrobiaceae bacterium]
MTDYINSGVLFKNDRKEQPNQPDYTGKINFNGQEKRLAAWIKEGQNGKFMSLKVSDFQRGDDRQPTPPVTQRGDLDDEIAF